MQRHHLIVTAIRRSAPGAGRGARLQEERDAASFVPPGSQRQWSHHLAALADTLHLADHSVRLVKLLTRDAALEEAPQGLRIALEDGQEQRWWTLHGGRAGGYEK